MLRPETAAALLVSEKVPALAAALLNREFAGGCAPTDEDARCHFAFLAQALEFARPELFTAYVAWVKPLLAHRGVPANALVHHLQCMTDVIESALPAASAGPAAAYVRAARAALGTAPDSLDASLGQLAPAAGDFLARLVANDARAARTLVLDLMRRGMGVGELYLQVLQPAMHEVGRLWQAARLSVAQEHYCAGVTQGVMGEISSAFREVRGSRTAVVACVAGEQHALGSRMVADFLDMSGWRTLWLGASTPSGDLLRMVCDLKAELLAVSCTYAPGLHEVASLIAALRALPECSHVKVLVGGYAFGWCDGLWRDVGADAYAPDAARAAQCAHRLMDERGAQPTAMG